MSRWWSERVELFLGDLPATAPAPGAEAVLRGDALAEHVTQVVEARQLSRGTRLSFTVAADLVRFVVVPWRDGLSSVAERRVLAEQCFAEIYGDIARQWTVRLQPSRPGAAALACAIDTGLLERIAAVAREHGLVIDSVQPSLMRAFNRVRADIGAGSHWFVAIERQWTSLLLQSTLEPLHVKRVVTARVELAGLLDREWFTLGLDLPRCPVYVERAEAGAVRGDRRPFTDGGWSMVDLTPPPTTLTQRPRRAA